MKPMTKTVIYSAVVLLTDGIKGSEHKLFPFLLETPLEPPQGPHFSLTFKISSV